MRLLHLITILAAAALLTGCGNPNPSEGTGEAFGFFSGIWDGLTVFFAFVGKMFGADMNIYEVANNGNWYNFGFLFGVGSWGILSWGGDSCDDQEEEIKKLKLQIKKLENNRT